MRRRPGTGLLLLMALPAALHGQEMRQPDPQLQIERTPPPGQLPLEGRMKVLMSRRARLGFSANMRARETDSIGVLVQAVAPNGPAARAGLRSGDIITQLNGLSLVVPGRTDGSEVSLPGLRLSELATDLEPGDSVSLAFRRGTQRRTILVVAGEEPAFMWGGPDGPLGYLTGDDPENQFFRLQVERTPGYGVAGLDSLRIQLDGASPGELGGPDGAMRLRIDSMRIRERTRFPSPMMFMVGSPLADLELVPLNPDLGRYFGTKEGILVINVPAGSQLRLKPGDVVLRVNGRAPSNPVHLLKILRSYDPGESVQLEIMRMKKRETIVGQAGSR